MLADLDVFLVGVHRDPDELDQREHARGDRRVGEARQRVMVDRIHAFGPYDVEVDTTTGVSTELTDAVLTAWRRRTSRRALRPANLPDR